MQKFRSGVILIVLVLCAISAYAQPKDNSPYSRIGLGDLMDQNFAAISSIGGLSAAYNDPNQINLLNPASLSFLNTTSFEIGFNARFNTLTDGTSTLKTRTGNVSYLSIGFPMKNPVNRVLDQKKSPYHWGMNFSLMPFSEVAYNIETEELVPGVDTVTYSYQGSGGSYKLYWGNSVRYKDISVGVNLGYLFGQISNEREIEFQDYIYGYRNLYRDQIRMNGFVYSLGAQYNYVFKKLNEESGKMEPTGKRITVGAYGNNSQNFSTNSSRLTRRYSPATSLSTSVAIDTLFNEAEIKQTGVLPGEISFGVIYEDFNKFRIGVNYAAAGWNNYENPAKGSAIPENLQNSYRLSFGGEYTPDIRSYNNYAKRIRYRLGGFYGTDPRTDNLNKQLTEYGITLGLGLPIILKNRPTSYVNLSFETGKQGTDDNLSKTYGKIILGFTLTDNTWFFKRKFN